MRKAVFFDIDGTLIGSHQGIKEMTNSVKEAVRTLQEQGHSVWVATGRPYAFLSKEIVEFGFDGFILANGAHIMEHGKTVYFDPMDHEFVTEFVELLEEHHAQYILEGEHFSYIKREFKECCDFYEQFGVMRKMLQPEYRLDDIRVLKLELLCPNTDVFKACLNLVENHPEYDNYHSMTYLLMEVYPKKNTKATGIHKVLERLNIPVECSYAFGDGKNDIEMLEAVGCGIAMGNAEDYVKQVADVVTSSVAEDGVAQGIRQFILSQESY